MYSAAVAAAAIQLPFAMSSAVVQGNQRQHQQQWQRDRVALPGLHVSNSFRRRVPLELALSPKDRGGCTGISLEVPSSLPSLSLLHAFVKTESFPRSPSQPRTERLRNSERRESRHQTCSEYLHSKRGREREGYSERDTGARVGCPSARSSSTINHASEWAWEWEPLQPLPCTAAVVLFR